MKAEVYYSGVWWYGRVYANWAFGGLGWRCVTDKCLTKWGAILSLKLWLRKNASDMSEPINCKK